MNLQFYTDNALFQGMKEEEIEEALACLNVYKRDYKKHEVIYHAGSATGFLGLIYKGSVIVERNDMWGNRAILTSFSTGEFFAEAYAMNPSMVIPVDIVSQEDTTVIFLEIGRLSASDCVASPVVHKLTQNLLRISLQKNMLLSNRSFILGSKTMRGKLLAYFNTIALQQGSNDIQIPFDRQQLADYLNLDRTALSKELAKMKDDGLIDYKKNHFVLLGVSDQ